MEGFYLADRKFVAGDKISIADLLYSCELDEMQLLDGVEQVGSVPFLTCARTTLPTVALYNSLCMFWLSADMLICLQTCK